MASKAMIWMIATMCATVLADPNSQNPHGNPRPKILGRNNNYHLHCSNAPDHEGGFFLDPASVPPYPPTLPPTGSNQQSMQFMWCTPGTNTYTFFGSWTLEPPPLDYMNYTTALNLTGESYANQKDVWVPDGGFTVDPAGTNVQIHMENAGGGKLTWGIVNSALAGLYQFQSVYGNGDRNQNPFIFQVNDGAWGEIAIGYAAFLRPADGVCILQINDGKEIWCQDLHKTIN